MALGLGGDFSLGLDLVAEATLGMGSVLVWRDRRDMADGCAGCTGVPGKRERTRLSTEGRTRTDTHKVQRILNQTDAGEEGRNGAKDEEPATEPGDFAPPGPDGDAVAPIRDLVEWALVEGLKLATETGDTAAAGKLADALRVHRETSDGGEGAVDRYAKHLRLVSNGDDDP